MGPCHHTGHWITGLLKGKKVEIASHLFLHLPALFTRPGDILPNTQALFSLRACIYTLVTIIIRHEIVGLSLDSDDSIVLNLRQKCYLKTEAQKLVPLESRTGARQEIDSRLRDQGSS